MTRLGDLFDFGNFSKPVATISLPKSPTFLGNFYNVSKSLIFIVKSFLGNFDRHLATFYWSHSLRPLTSVNEALILLWQKKLAFRCAGLINWDTIFPIGNLLCSSYFPEVSRASNPDRILPDLIPLPRTDWAFAGSNLWLHLSTVPKLWRRHQRRLLSNLNKIIIATVIFSKILTRGTQHYSQLEPLIN